MIKTCKHCHSALHPTTGHCPQGHPQPRPKKKTPPPPAAPPILPKQICAHCGTIDQVKKHTPGDIGVEVLLWIFLLIPGIIYSLWRITNRQTVCRTCGHPHLIPYDSPRGRELHQQQQQRAHQNEPLK